MFRVVTPLRCHLNHNRIVKDRPEEHSPAEGGHPAVSSTGDVFYLNSSPEYVPRQTAQSVTLHRYAEVYRPGLAVSKGKSFSQPSFSPPAAVPARPPLPGGGQWNYIGPPFAWKPGISTERDTVARVMTQQ